MFTLRCTSRLLTRLRAKPEAAPPAPTTRLGDWYANLLHVGRQQLVLAVSERTLLPVVIPASPGHTLVPRLVEGVAEVLRALAIPRDGVVAELEAMKPAAFAKTANRSVVGILVDFEHLLGAFIKTHATLRDVSLHLARVPCRPLDPDSFPDTVTRKLFTASNA